MICITSNVTPTRVPPKTYRIRNDAIDAALLALGPHARNGFEYLVTKVDGRWIWRPTDEVKAPTHAEMKAMGGKRAFLSNQSQPSQPWPNLSDPGRTTPLHTDTRGMGTAMASVTPQGTIAPASEALAARVAMLEGIVGELILRMQSI